jgi:sugar phosphate isomerase/epimerase
VVIDSYHVWRDPRIGAGIALAAGRIAGYEVCDWVVPLPADALLGRGHLGDGVIDFRALTGAVLDTGYAGYVEVEIVNEKVWDAPADQTVATIKERFAAIFG